MSQQSEEKPRRAWTRGVFSAASNPAWLNQATVKGLALILAGAALAITPRQSERFVPHILGALLLVWGGSELWFRVVRQPARGLANVALPLALIVGGVALVVDVGPAFSVVIGVALIVRALFVAYGRIRGEFHWRDYSFFRVALLLTAGIAMVVVPEASMLGLRALAGGLGVLLGAILVAVGVGPEDQEEVLEIDLRGAGRLAEDWLGDQRLDPQRVEEISDTLFFEMPNRGKKLASFWVMMLLATAIATFAIIQNSTAVVIGAMLVAPLMTPIMGIAAGMVNGWAGRMFGSLILVAAAVGAAILLAWTIGAWLPSVGDLGTNGQITSRTSPNLLDLCIAVAAGAAGAYATVNPRVSSSLSGVAIAVALVPPLAVVGLTLEAGMGDDALGAFLLFCTNFVSIILTGAVVLVLTGFARFPLKPEDSEQRWRMFGPVLLGAILIVVPLTTTSLSVWDDTTHQAQAESAVAAWLGEDSGLSTVQLDVTGNSVDLVLTGSTDPPPVDDLQESLDQDFDADVDLEVRVVPSEVLTDQG